MSNPPLRRRVVGSEEALYEQLARYLNLKHSDVPYHFDLSGLWTPSHRLRNLYGRLNARAWPDLFIAKPVYDPIAGPEYPYCGLFVELKREGTRLKKKNGEWASEHIAEQAAVLNKLADEGYVAQFAVGFDEAVQLIESYLAGGAMKAAA